MAIPSFTVEREAQFDTIPHNVGELTLGRAHRRRPAHVDRQDTLVLRSEMLAGVIMALSMLSRVYALAVRWVVDLLPTFPSPAPTNVVHFLQQSWPGDDLRVTEVVVGQRQIALPVNTLLGDQNAAPLHHVPSDVRVVQVVFIPLTAACVQRLSAHDDSRAFGEAILDVASCSPDEAANVGRTLGVVGEFLKDLSIRWSDPAGLERVHADNFCRLLQFPLCTSLLSLTLSLAFVAGRHEVAKRQWAMNICLLNSSTATALRRFQLCIFVPDVDVLAQVKQTQWRLILDALARFPALHTVTVVIKGTDETLCDEVWQQIEFTLRISRERGALLKRGSFSVLYSA